MFFTPTLLEDAYLIQPDRHCDDRGYFARTMCFDEFAEHGLVCEFVQQSVSFTAKAGTIRGLHFQYPPFGEAKLVRCSRGAIQDVIVDLRPGSRTYLRSQGFRLDEVNGHQLYVPPGFAHSFQTLVDNVEVCYLISERYAPEAQGGLRYDDPQLGIEWPLPVAEISPRDMGWPLIQPEAPPAL
jgi:dTDP-4-dehydrorhamnose 3,5-epimerase